MMHHFIVIGFGLVFVGIAALVVTLLGIMFFKGTVFLLNGLFGESFRTESRRVAHALPPVLVCPNPRCLHQNRNGARFCAMCGDRLKSPYNTDTYG